MIELDFSNTKTLEEVQWKPLPDGEYAFTIADAEVVPSKTGKAPSMKVVLQYAEDGKTKVFDWFFLDSANDFAMASLKDFLEKVYGEPITGNLELDPKDLISRNVVAQITVSPRKDKPNLMQNEVVAYIGEPF